MKPKIKTTCTKLQLQLLSFCLLCLSGKTRCDGNGPAVVTVEQDSDAVLPCSLSSKENIEFHLFDWKKPAQIDGGQKEVFYYDAGIHYNNGYPGQSEEFKGRVSHFPEELKHGNASIIIRNTMVADSGDYTCDFPDLQPPQTFHIKLAVDGVLKDRTDENTPGATSKPNIRTLDETNNRALLQCEVHGNPQPEVEWRDSAGNKLPAEEPQVSERDGRFYVTLNTAVTKTDRYRCVATQKDISHQIYDETFVHITEPVVVIVEQDEDALLPCSLRTNKNIEQGYFDWNKFVQHNERQKEVFLYDKGRHSPNFGSQDDGFKGRVSHFPQELKHGNASIIIRNTKMADSGNYTCTFTEPRQTFHIELVVGAAPKPVITTLDQTDNRALLQCEVHGNPQPEVEWRDSAGNKLPAQKSQVSERHRRFFITLNTTVTKTDRYRCVATQKNINHHIYTETFVRLNGPAVVTVEQDSDAVLPCSLSSKENIELYLFDWKKPAQIDGGQKEVFQYDAGFHYNNGRAGQSEEFKGRVSHFPEELKHGNAAIIIRNTMVPDSGNYTCVFPRLQPPQTFHIKLVVEPVVVRVKEDRDALLPCSLSTKKNISQGHFDWNKLAQNGEKQKEVFRYEKGKHSPSFGSQDDGFKGRIFHFPQEPEHGNASIIIRNTKMADSGDYTCTFTEPRKTFHVKLDVGGVLKDRTDEKKTGAVSKPNIRTLNETDNWALLQCEVHGNPQPEVEWRDSAGKTLPAQKSLVKERGEFFITLNTTVTKTDHYRCVATQKEISHQISTETFVRLNDSTPGWVIAIVAVLCSVIVGGGILAVLVYKGCITLNCKKGSPADHKEGSAVPLNGRPSQSQEATDPEI